MVPHAFTDNGREIDKLVVVGCHADLFIYLCENRTLSQESLLLDPSFSTVEHNESLAEDLQHVTPSPSFFPGNGRGDPREHRFEVERLHPWVCGAASIVNQQVWPICSPYWVVRRDSLTGAGLQDIDAFKSCPCKVHSGLWIFPQFLQFEADELCFFPLLQAVLRCEIN